MKSFIKFSPLLVLVFPFFVSCDFFDIPEESDLPIQEWEVTAVAFRSYTDPPSFSAGFLGPDVVLYRYSYYKDFDRTIPLKRSSLMTIPGVTFGSGGGFTTNGLMLNFESGPEITESTVATFNNEWFYQVEEDGNLFNGTPVVAKIRIVTKTMGITIVE
ncbi:MAG: hypothetical protein BWY20_01716 [Spirochaetes bacterium ADurb.Bin215]|nr:MAG: hypothetical protein BWY20_01716 [Spirochaetes bacterium ADurb.Bin215]